MELPGGETERYYVEIPEETATVRQYFLDLPVQKFPELEGMHLEDLVRSYVEKLSSLVERAKIRFLKDYKPAGGHTQKATHLRLVKK